MDHGVGEVFLGCWHGLMLRPARVILFAPVRSRSLLFFSAPSYDHDFELGFKDGTYAVSRYASHGDFPILPQITPRLFFSSFYRCFFLFMLSFLFLTTDSRWTNLKPGFPRFPLAQFSILTLALRTLMQSLFSFSYPMHPSIIVQRLSYHASSYRQ